MPIYEYVCSGCGIKFELLRPFTQANKGASCPHCHKNAERIFSPFASFSKSEGGLTTSLAGNNHCAGCSSSSCSSCSL